MKLQWRGLASALLLSGVAAGVEAQEVACKALYDATLNALAQPGMHRLVRQTTPDGSVATSESRKTAEGWYTTSNGGEWFAQTRNTDEIERALAQDPRAFTQCKPRGSEEVAGVTLQAWSYVSMLSGQPLEAKMWIDVARRLPVRVAAADVEQYYTYSDQPYPKP